MICYFGGAAAVEFVNEGLESNSAATLLLEILDGRRLAEADRLDSRAIPAKRRLEMIALGAHTSGLIGLIDPFGRELREVSVESPAPLLLCWHT